MRNPRRRTVPFVLIVLIVISTLATIDVGRRYLEGEFEQDTITFEMLYSSEKGKWLEEIAPIFEREWAQNSSISLRLILTPIGSGRGTLQVARSISKPVVWSPASRFWLSTLNYLWEKENDNPIVDVNAEALVISPTVIATWKSYQQEHNITSMEDLRELAIDPDSGFTFAHTDPSRSNSGFGGVIMQVATALDKNPEDITLDDLADPDVHKWMTQLESAAIEYGSSTGFLAKLLLNGGPSKLKVALIYENLVVEKNKGIESYGYNDSLVAVYPKEGTVLNDHPFGLLDAPWVSEKQKEVGRIFLKFLLREDIQERAVRTGFRPAVTLSNSSVESEIFNEKAGVIPSIRNLTIYDIGNIRGEVLERIPDLWLATRAIGVVGEDINTLKVEDLIIPVALLALIVLMISYPLVSYVRAYLRRRRR